MRRNAGTTGTGCSAPQLRRAVGEADRELGAVDAEVCLGVARGRLLPVRGRRREHAPRAESHWITGQRIEVSGGTLL